MDSFNLLVGLLGILLAIGIPIWIEYVRRPRISVELGETAGRESPGAFRIVHVRVINRPIEGWLGKSLLRNPATSCRAKITIWPKAGTAPIHSFGGKWSSTPEPIQYLPAQGPLGSEVQPAFDPSKWPATLVVDVAAGDAGEVVAIAIKHEGEQHAYAFDPQFIYQDPARLRHADVRLDEGIYEVVVEADAGEIRKARRFWLSNAGGKPIGLDLSEA